MDGEDGREAKEEREFISQINLHGVFQGKRPMKRRDVVEDRAEEKTVKLVFNVLIISLCSVKEKNCTSQLENVT